MRVLGLIVEYNPMHLGHLYHIKTAQQKTKADVTIAVMSGSVVQRGDFSVIDKFIKTDVALKTGIDIVIELPSFYVLQAADYFAKAAVALLAELCVTDFVFGSESGDLKPLQSMAQWMREKAFDEALKSHLQKGLSYADAITHAVGPLNKKYLTPNNTLGISYLKALQAYPQIEVATIKREKRMYYDAFEDHATIQSATALRHQIFASEPVDKYVVEALKPYLKDFKPLKVDHLFPVFIGQLKMMSKDRFDSIYGLTEGIENRFLKATEADDYLAFLEAVKTPRYTYSHLQRTLMHLLLSTPKAFKAYDSPPYLRLLGMTETGKTYLNHIKKQLSIPLYTSAKNDQHPLLDFEQQISSLIEPFVQRPLKALDIAPPIQIAK
jgi:predicted nucleotidyltransferase